jgi:hypothetical protein
MNKRLTLIYWKSEKFWLEENIKDASLLLTMDDVPAE